MREEIVKIDKYKILSIAFILMIACNLVHPITPEMLAIKNTRDSLFGILFGVMNLGNFLASFWWGRRIDKKGIKNIFVIVLCFYLIFQLIFGITNNPFIMIIARFFAGICVGGMIISFTTYISVVVEKKQKIKYLGYLTVAVVTGSIAGQMIGGIIGLTGYLNVFYMQAIFISIIIVIIIIFLTERKTNSQKENNENTKFNPGKYFKKEIIWILIIETIFVIGWSIYTTTLPYYASNIVGLESDKIGIINSLLKVGGLISALMVGYYVRKVGIFRIYSITIFMSVIFIFIFAFQINHQINYQIYLVTILIIGYFAIMHRPLVQEIGMILENKNRGEVIGLLQGVIAFGLFIGSISSGFIYSISPGLGFWISGIIIAFAIVIQVMYMVKYKRW